VHEVSKRVAVFNALFAFGKLFVAFPCLLIGIDPFAEAFAADQQVIQFDGYSILLSCELEFGYLFDALSSFLEN
jgi:hypothetical protein